jgi:hypothetical protein
VVKTREATCSLPAHRWMADLYGMRLKDEMPVFSLVALYGTVPHRYPVQQRESSILISESSVDGSAEALGFASVEGTG